MRQVTLEIDGEIWRTTLDEPVRLSIPLDFRGAQPNAFGLPEASAAFVSYGDAVCDVRQNGDFNCSRISLIPHGNGTHTESAAHVATDAPEVGELVDEPLIPATVLTVEPVQFGSTPEGYSDVSRPSDSVVTRERLATSSEQLDADDPFFRALAIRTKPNATAKRTRDYSDTNPPYLTRDAVDWCLEREVEHLLVDLPSIDREHDRGGLTNHRAFWEIESPSTPPNRRTITELCYVPDSTSDGLYFLDLEVPDFALDAAPSRPLLYEAMQED